MSQIKPPQLRSVVEGDASRRLKDSYIPDFYRNNENYEFVVRFAELMGPSFDVGIAFAEGLPALVNVEECPEENLESLGALIGYNWNPLLDFATNRRLIQDAVGAFSIKGSAPSVLRLVRRAGARKAAISTPFESIYRTSSVNSSLSGSYKLEDSNYWRWGTYVVESDIDATKFETEVLRAHPAGTVVYFVRKVTASNSSSAPVVSASVSIDYPVYLDSVLDSPDTNNAAGSVTAYPSTTHIVGAANSSPSLPAEVVVELYIEYSDIQSLRDRLPGFHGI